MLLRLLENFQRISRIFPMLQTQDQVPSLLVANKVSHSPCGIVQNAVTSMPKPVGHIPALDALRGAAVFLVMVDHIAKVRLGWIGVSLFFVLSGFLITGILYDSKAATHYFRNFYARRMLRIFPLYYGALLALFVVLPLVLSFGDLHAKASAFLGDHFDNYQTIRSNQIWLWFYGLNIACVCGVSDWYGTAHFWSLAVEEHFYLFWPVVVFLCNRRALLAICLACIGASLAIRIGMYFTGTNPWLIYVFTPCRLDELAVGGMLALMVRDRAWQGLGSRAGWIAIVSGAAFFAGFWYLGGFHGPFTLIAGFLLLAVFFGSILLLALRASPMSLWGRLLHWKPLLFLGKYSYGLYVVQPLVTTPLRKAFASETVANLIGSPILSSVAFAISSFAVSIAVALLSWHLFEKHFLKLKKYFA